MCFASSELTNHKKPEWNQYLIHSHTYFKHLQLQKYVADNPLENNSFLALLCLGVDNFLRKNQGREWRIMMNWQCSKVLTKTDTILLLVYFPPQSWNYLGVFWYVLYQTLFLLALSLSLKIVQFADLSWRKGMLLARGIVWGQPRGVKPFLHTIFSVLQLQ